jgi:glucose-6-phosphate dehydrogenase assembly protein OpcA
MSATVHPDRVLKELADLWTSLAKEGQGEGSGVLRACTMTLVVAAEASDDWAKLGETLAALMPEHPARAISIHLSGSGERALSERVYSQCWMPFGQRRQICCEQVEITASDSALLDLPPVVRPLAVPDLPLILWCRSPRLLGMPEFNPIGSMAQKVIIDSEGLPLKDIVGLVPRGTRLGDLAWTRLTRWRETLSQVFENKENLARISSLKNLTVTHVKAQTNTATYLAAWISTVLPSVKTRVTEDESCDSLRVALSGDGLEVKLEREGDRLAVHVNGLSHYTSLSMFTDYSLMREELGIVQRDPVFDRALSRAEAGGF